MNRDVMNRERAIARNHHHALEHGFVIERARFDRDLDLRFRHLGADRPRERSADFGNAIERKRPANRDDEIDEQCGADRAGAPCRSPANRPPAPRDSRAR